MSFAISIKGIQYRNMKKQSSSSLKTPRSQKRSQSNNGQQAEILAALKSLDQIEPPSPKTAGIIALLRSWLTDESGYDEKTWPKLKNALNKERDRVGARRLVDD